MQEAIATALSLQVDCVDSFSLAEQVAGIRLIRELALTHQGAGSIDGLRVVLDIPSIESSAQVFTLPSLHAGEVIDLSNLPFNPDLALVRTLTENERVGLRCLIEKDGVAICKAETTFELLVSNAWKIGAWELYASFITSNHPVIAQVCKQISSKLSELGCRNSLEGYQGGSPARTVELVRATYLTLSNLDISYIDPPQFWTKGFQRIRLPDQVLAERLGTCADLTPLAAACLEHIGLCPVIIFVNGHVFPGAFTNPERPAELPALIDDVQIVYSLCDAGELVLFDSSEYATHPESGFEGAATKARDYLGTFTVLVNLYQARRNGYRPLPIRMSVVPDHEGEVLSLAKQILLSAAKQTSSPSLSFPEDASASAENESIPSVVAYRFQRWKEKLLDLSSRNRLLHLENVDLSKVAVRYFHEIALQVLKKLACDTRESNEELSDAIISVASSIRPEDIRPDDFSYQRQLLLGDYFASLMGQLPEPLQEVCGELISKDRDSIISQVFRKIHAALGSRKSAFLALDIPAGLLANFEDLLASGRELTILGDSLSGHGDEALAITTKELTEGIVRSCLTIGSNEALPSELLYRAGRTLAREAKISIEESGFSPLYLAFGLLQWKESDSAAPRLAPLILYPIEISLDARSHKVKIARTKSEPIGNITLVEKLRRDLDLHLDILSDLPVDESGLDLDSVLSRVRSTVADKAGWKVLETSLITSFSFGKFLLWRDLQDNSEILLESNTVRHIATAGRESFSDPLSELQISDLDKIAYQDLPIVLPSDSSQLAAVYAALNGRSFVLQGPPGTGKSQTIANIIASAIANGKTVLFVAEKAAAADVVARRLSSIGLGEFCLDLHHPDTSSEEVLSSLSQALTVNERDSSSWERHCAELEKSRSELRELTSTLHQRLPIGYTLFQMASALSGSITSMHVISKLAPLQLTADQFQENLKNIQHFVDQVSHLSAEARSTWEFVGTLQWSLKLDSSLREAFEDLCGSLRVLKESLSPFLGCSLLSLGDSLAAVSAFLGYASVQPWRAFPPALIDREWWLESKAKAQSWMERKSALDQQIASLSERWQPQAFTDNLKDYHDRIFRLREKNIIIRWLLGFRLRRELKRYLRNPRQSFQDILRDLDTLLRSRLEGSDLEQDMLSLQAALGTWDGKADSLAELMDRCNLLHAKIDKLPDSSEWLKNLQSIPEPAWSAAFAAVTAVQQAMAAIGSLLELSDLDQAFSPSDSVSEVLDRSEHLILKLDLLRAWCSFSQVWNQFQSSPLGPVLEWEAVKEDISSLPDMYETHVLKAWFTHCFDESVRLREFDPDRHEVSLQHFRSLETKFLELSRNYVRAQVIAQMPNRTLNVNGSELSELTRETVKKRNRLPIRSLFTRIPTLLPRLKPCILASPISVARFLPADSKKFDIVLFDEASQVETHDAIGAIARGEQVIIVGDNKQMPPTNFFARSVSAVDDLADPDCVDDLESILDEAIACNLPEQSLSWHYRSRHQSLIAFSNDRYYSGALNVFPSSELARADLGVLWHYQEQGAYQPGIRHNRIEAEALVRFLVQRLKNSEPSTRSFGIVTFSTPQQSLIENLLAKECEIDPSLERWFDKANLEYCFVKNLETVQGDERDEILFSICYGPQKDGKVSMSFGPLNRIGGERRLNVAITRARTALHVFTSILPEQIDLSRTNALAVRHLREFLHFVRRTQPIVEEPAVVSGAAGALHGEILQVLQDRGYQVDTYVGCGDFRLEFAVRHPHRPGAYLLGIECDGDAYVSAATVRDRECLRYAVLTQLGWSLHRVWSLEWLLNRAKEEDRLIQALERAAQKPSIDQPLIATAGASADTQASDPPALLRSSTSFSGSLAKIVDQPNDESFDQSLASAQRLGLPYKTALLPLVSANLQDFYQSSADYAIQQTLIELLSVEAPMTFESAARRVYQCWSGKSFTTRASERVSAVIGQLTPVRQLYVDQRGCLWRSQSQAENWKGFRLPPQEGRKLDQIPVIEIEQAVVLITQAALSIDREMLIREVYAVLTPFKKLTQSVRDILDPVIDELLRTSKLTFNDGRLFPG